MNISSSDANEEKTLLHAVVCFFLKHENGINKVLLGIKAAKIGKGKRLPYGGGIEAHETPEQAAAREVLEETDGQIIIREKNLRKIAIGDITTTKSDGTDFVCRIHFFTATVWTGEFMTTKDIIDPQWYDVLHLPIEELMLADKLWLPVALEQNVGNAHQKYLVGAHYGPYQESLIGSVTLTPVEVLP
jgi:8-oxo-dGTP pyrophosphatase MutT (NUDIX family)